MKRFVLFATVLVSALIVAACGGVTQSAAPQATAAQATSVPVVQPTATTAPAAEANVQPTTEPAQPTEVVEQPTSAPTEATATEPTVSDTNAAAPVAVANTKLNLNTVTADELTSMIPGFSNRMVREFQEYRPYVSIQQFRREIGKYVDDATVAGYEQYVYVPVDVNQSDADSLMQLSGVDDAVAADLIAGRPYDSNEAFLAQLTQLVSADDAAAAAGYLQAQ
ncbi:MAG: hypothetical protein KDI12_02615 [Anaerolineae bacterium]|nr:hypothetical protein [Anaerolineae bacterium]